MSAPRDWSVFPQSRSEFPASLQEFPESRLLPFHTIWEFTQYIFGSFLTGCIAIEILRTILTRNTTIRYYSQVVKEEEENYAVYVYKYLLQLKLLTTDLKQAITSGEVAACIERLYTMRIELILPFLYDMSIYGLLYPSILALIVTFTMYYTPFVTIHVFMAVFQQGIYAYFLRAILCFAYYPLRHLQESLHRRLIDENYLIGRTLVNNNVQVSVVVVCI